MWIYMETTPNGRVGNENRLPLNYLVTQGIELTIGLVLNGGAKH